MVKMISEKKNKTLPTGENMAQKQAGQPRMKIKHRQNMKIQKFLFILKFGTHIGSRESLP